MRSTSSIRCGRRCLWVNQTGMILPTTLVFMGVLALLGTSAFVMSTTEMKIGKNHLVGEQAFYAARAGCEAAKARLADSAADPIPDAAPAHGDWRAYIGDGKAVIQLGFDSTNPLHFRYERLSEAIPYIVRIGHAKSIAGLPLYWGDADGDGLFERNTVAGKNIYQVTTVSSVQGCSHAVQTQVAEIPPVTAPAALYVKGQTTLGGGSTHIIGFDGCGGSHTSGITTPQGVGAVTVLGGAQVTGTGATGISYDGVDMNVVALVDFYARYADVSYSAPGISHAASTLPGPGDDWGHPVPGPTLQDPASCASRTIVHYDTAGTYVQFSEGVQGCGILLVEGDLEIEGDFLWYGPVIVTGSVVFSGGGERNITGALVSGEDVLCDVSGGNSNIIYCRNAVTSPTEGRPLQLLAWKSSF